MPEPTKAPARDQSVRFDLGGWGLRLANHQPERLSIIPVAFVLAMVAVLVPSKYAVTVAFGALVAAQFIAAVVLSCLPVRVDTERPRIRTGLRRTDAARLTRASVSSNGQEQYLYLGRSEFSRWVICIATRGTTIDASQRDALERLIAASNIDLPPIKPDRYDPTGRFSRIGTDRVSKQEAIAAIRASAPLAP